jgi:hypothetical protein
VESTANSLPVRDAQAGLLATGLMPGELIETYIARSGCALGYARSRIEY